VDLEDIAERFEVSGGEIVNILRSTAIRAAQHGRHRVEPADLLEAIRMEFQKAGRIPDRKPE
jgi:ATP-dependent 26S proteasome regulatory subunit